MKQRPRIYYSDTQKAVMWDRWQKGVSGGRPGTMLLDYVCNIVQFCAKNSSHNRRRNLRICRRAPVHMQTRDTQAPS